MKKNTQCKIKITDFMDSKTFPKIMSKNKMITNNGIKHMNLSILHIDGSNITNDGIKNMNLHVLYINNNITDDCIKNMDLSILNINIGNITDNGIKNMKLHSLLLYIFFLYVAYVLQGSRPFIVFNYYELCDYIGKYLLIHIISMVVV